MLSIVHFGSVRDRAALLCLLLVMALLSGACGAPFRANDDALVAFAGAAGEEPALSGIAGSSGAPMTTTSAGAAGAPSAGAGGSPITTAPDAGAGGSGAACLAGWRGSSCDTCTSSAPTPAGRSCAEVIDCYAEHACTPETCSGLCDYSAPTSDAAVREAHRVAACRCGGGV